MQEHIQETRDAVQELYAYAAVMRYRACTAKERTQRRQQADAALKRYNAAIHKLNEAMTHAEETLRLCALTFRQVQQSPNNLAMLTARDVQAVQERINFALQRDFAAAQHKRKAV
jgi:mannitol-1-phosphate/altronate dehydrogenase